MYISKDIADRIRSTAKASGIVIKDMLSDVQLGENTLHNMNSSMPKADNLAKIADYLGVSVDYLLGREKKDAPGDSVRSAIIDKVKRLSDDQANQLLAFLETILPE